MLRVSRPQRTLLLAFGVAGAVLAAVIIAFTSTGEIVAVDLSPGNPRPAASKPIVLAGRVSSAPATTPLEPSKASAAAAAPVAPAPRSAPAPAVARPVQSYVPAAQMTAVEAPGRPDPAAPPPPPPAPPPRQAPEPPPPRGEPLAPVGDFVVDTTTVLANTLRAATTELGSTTAPVSPELGKLVVDTGELAGDVVEATGDRLGGLLGPPAVP